MSISYERYAASADALRARLDGRAPEVGVVLGSGLGQLAEEVEDAVAVDYRDIPYFHGTTAPGHRGRMIFGTLAGKSVAVMQGRIHYYEGCSYEEVTYGVRVMRLLGCTKLVLTNAAGCVRKDWHVGDLMLITDQIKMQGDSPLRGENLQQFGTRFPDATHLYSLRLQATARRAAARLGITLREGIYFYCMGPQYETPAEIRAVRALGGDAVGMSTAPETIAAAHCGMEVLGLSLLANMAAGILDKPLTEQDVLDAAGEASIEFSALLRACLKEM